MAAEEKRKGEFSMSLDVSMKDLLKAVCILVTGPIVGIRA
jgi:hypothetical protein